ncbi:hypothetical protein F220043C3_02650 [Enterocloster asparagiformis]|uniref:hypothetical protein n=1 Tax=Enterocloster asparagiformis TaxID=333367 RepID=UPI0023540C25
MRFSKRECVLLTVLAVLLIWSVGRSRILEPAMERRMSAREECSRLERERIEAEQFIDVVIVSEPTLEESGDRFFYETMEDVAFDRLFQRMARESGLTVRRLEIIRSESGKGDFQPERAVPRAESTDSAGNSGGAGSSGSAGNSGSLGNASGPEFRYAQIHLELAGDSVRDAMRMADRIDAEPASMVVSYMGIEPDSRVKASASETAGVICRMDVDIYWVEPRAAEKGME